MLSNNRSSLSPRDQKELYNILTRINEGVQTCLQGIHTLFFSRRDNEVKQMAKSKIEDIRAKCILLENIKDMYDAQALEIQNNKQEISALIQSGMQLSVEKDTLDSKLKQLQETLNEHLNELGQTQERVCSLE